ncbi:MAG: hypothetical protein EPO21_14725 [Chloroflexota bacterium]|nr:MAG: hypothetical protein EPO21_14725 [Chloroflexota bacterium]
MSVGVFVYSRSQALTRALLGNLLDDAQIKGLANADDLVGTVRILRGTTYGPWLEGPEFETLPGAERALDTSTVDAYERIRDSLTGPSRALIVGLARRVELLNLLAVLRALVRGRNTDEVANLWVDLGDMATLPREALLRATDVFEVARLVERTPYGPALHHALDRYRQERSLFPLEMSLQLDYYGRLWDLAERLMAQDRSSALRLLGLWYDLVNIEWVIRFRLLYQLSPEELFNYTLPHGRLIDSQTLRHMATASSLAEIVEVLPALYQHLLTSVTRGTDELWRVGVALGRGLRRAARSELLGYPFRISLQVAYVWLKEIEVRDLKTILEAKQYQKPAEEIEPLLFTLGG